MPLKDKELRKRYLQEYYLKNTAKQKESALYSKYRLRFADYNQILEKQNFSCALCHKSVDNTPKPLQVDHDHNTGKIRGLLCMQCNVGLGMLGDNIFGLERALKYLKDNS